LSFVQSLLRPTSTKSCAAPAAERSQTIDLLRGLSVCFVILLHINIRIPFKTSPIGAAWPKWAISDLFRNGHNGVVIFFVISGFLITSMSLRRWGGLEGMRPAAFYRMRFARIAPLLAAVLAALSVLHLCNVSGFVIDAKTASLPRALFAAATFHLNWLEAQRGYLPGNWDVLWSLSVEETFYLAFPLACWLRKRWLWALLIAALIVSGPFARAMWTQNDLWQDKSYLACMDAIALGCLAAWLANRRPLARAWRWALGLLGGAMIGVMLFFKIAIGAMHLYLDHTYDCTTSFLAVGAAMLLWAQAASPTIGWRWLRLLSLPLRVVGRSSYEIYLTHMFVVTALFNLYQRWGSPIAQAPQWFAAMLMLAIALGVVVDRWFSAPLNRLLRGARREA